MGVRDEIRRNSIFTMRLRPHERAAVEEAAERARCTITEFVRDAAMKAAARQLR